MGANASLLAKWFIARTDVMAEQGSGGQYFPTRKRDGELIGFTRESLEQHLSGQRTLGHYLLSGQTCKLFAFDIDLDGGETSFNNHWSPLHGVTLNQRSVMVDQEHEHHAEIMGRMHKLAASIADIVDNTTKDVKTLISFSGSKGMHVYGLYGQYVDSSVAMRDITKVVGRLRGTTHANAKIQNLKSESWPGITIEVFPKQSSTKGFGNLMRLPLGVHRKSGKPGFIIDRESEPGLPTAVELGVALS